MIDDFEKVRSTYLNTMAKKLHLHSESLDDCNKHLMKKFIDYAFSKEFYQRWEEQKLLESHPALKDLHDQYKEMEALLKKDKE